ncbi:MAG: HAMP domain-containing histidine kinase [Bacteroidetes bacterium]|nr:HAMP domain-containing histidine kinase [Bacteroidota bacterium]
MFQDELKTYFDDPQKASMSEIFEQQKQIRSQDVLCKIINNFPFFVLILNKQRQIVEANSSALDSFKGKKLNEVLGLKVGEALGCIRKDEYPNGCGTTKFCKDCGAASAIMKSNKSLSFASEECRIIADDNGKNISLDYLVHTDSINIQNEEYTMFVVQDISKQKRLEVLEKMFFHDILNTGGAIHGLATILPMIENRDEKREIEEAILDSSKQLIEEIQAQRDLVYAEKGNLEVNPIYTYSNSIIKTVYEMYSRAELSQDKNFLVEYLTPDIEFKVDPILLIRSLSNLAKNALEATRKNETVKISTRLKSTSIVFDVFNSNVMDERVQNQLFQRSFSTKNGLGRGIGTYSVKLLVEQYLNGKVSFKSNIESKTIFSIELPI